MKAVLEFNLDLPEDRDAFKLANQALDSNLALSDIEGMLRGYSKYDHTFKSADEAVEGIRTEFYEILKNRNITLE